MHRLISKRRAVLNALGLLLLIVASLAAIASIGLRSGAFGNAAELVVTFERVDGLRSGDTVRLQGLRVGAVSQIDPPKRAGDPITTRLRIDPQIARLLRSDAVASIASQGLIGQPVVELSAGTPESPALDTTRPMAGRSAVSIAQLTERATMSLTKLEKLTEEAQRGVGQINAITEVIARGEGSLGQLVMKDDAYRKVIGVSDQGERTLEDLQENLEALKHSWFFSKTFDQRGFYDRDTVLFDPGADQFRQSLASMALFEPNTAILTTQGKSTIDHAVGVLKSALRPKSHVIVAAFSDDLSSEETISRALTQRQAEAVRDYLENSHRISYVSLFKWRKVTAVGFGSKPPNYWKPENAPLTRVDLVVTTPRSGAS
jgi:outer membrane protein OmpA-like peptidoglycan-associated protein